ncbi:hypothetical protein BC940DRAFT_310895 [Gongronella butleri]|nr:hypothetical protein BC940DRAFT_310895 [Gongronella butleri]
MYVTSGKDALTIPDYSLIPAFEKMMGGTCSYDRSTNHFFCQTNTNWRSAYWSGIMNIEFDCSLRPYMAYNQDWASYDYYCRGL